MVSNQLWSGWLSKIFLNKCDCGDDPNSHCVIFDNSFNNWYILVHLWHLGYQTPNTIRLNCIEDCSSNQAKNLQKEDRGAFDDRYDHNGKVLFVWWNNKRCVTLRTSLETINLFATVSMWKQDLKQTAGISQPTVLKIRNSHMVGAVDHRDWLVGKYVCYWCQGKSGTGDCSHRW